MTVSDSGSSRAESDFPGCTAFLTDFTVWYGMNPQQVKDQYENDLFLFDWQCGPVYNSVLECQEKEIDQYRQIAECSSIRDPEKDAPVGRFNRIA